MLYDITRTLSPNTSIWPGDTPLSIKSVLRLREGAPVNLKTLTFSPHIGTHADAFFHFEDDGDYPATMPLDAYIGRARVVAVERRSGALTPTDFAHVNLEGAERLLIHSHMSDQEDDQWTEDFPYLSVELIEWLASMDFRLIGLDSPSADAFNSTDLPCHHALWRHKIVILETLQLRDVPDGDYELIALPLKLDLVCGSPVRAVLQKLD